MKPGDLVKLVLPAPARSVENYVAVVWDLDGWIWERGGAVATRFPEGTAAVFLSPADDEDGAALLDCRILVEGRVGWVWSRYLEVIDETR